MQRQGKRCRRQEYGTCEIALLCLFADRKGLLEAGGLCVGRLKICLNERVPNDISDGKYVSVNVQRLDV